MPTPWTDLGYLLLAITVALGCVAVGYWLGRKR